MTLLAGELSTECSINNAKPSLVPLFWSGFDIAHNNCNQLLSFDVGRAVSNNISRRFINLISGKFAIVKPVDSNCCSYPGSSYCSCDDAMTIPLRKFVSFALTRLHKNTSAY